MRGRAPHCTLRGGSLAVHACIVPAAIAKPRDLFAQALGLPERERAALAVELLASLRPDGILDEEDPALLAEVERRAERVRSGESQGLDWDEVVDELA